MKKPEQRYAAAGVELEPPAPRPLEELVDMSGPAAAGQQTVPLPLGRRVDVGAGAGGEWVTGNAELFDELDRGERGGGS